MNFLEYLISLAMVSFLGLVLSQILFWQQGLKHLIEEKVEQAYAFILIHQHLQLIEDNLSSICSILPFSQTRDGLAFLGQELVHLRDSSLDYPVLQGDVEWFESRTFELKNFNPQLKYLLTNLRQHQMLERDYSGEPSAIKLSPPFLLIPYQAQHLDFKQHKIRIYHQGRPQTLASGLSHFSVKILNARQLEWQLQFQHGARFTWMVNICNKENTVMHLS